MISLQERRGKTMRARLARLMFAVGRRLLGSPTPTYYDYYASLIPAIDVVETEVDKVLASGDIKPDSHRDALMRLAQQLGRTRREGVIVRLALHDAGILILPTEELERIRKSYGLEVR